MLDNMSDGLLDHVEAKIMQIHEDFDQEILGGMRERVRG
jgi:hypothetical protein